MFFLINPVMSVSKRGSWWHAGLYFIWNEPNITNLSPNMDE